ncbi:hypothetical protein RN001_001797 [Aquatica leii]|uniref:Uncharacterized protein n=1 Tax=Aquatica leii TaxID=1421715 RepID=A0AAN7SCX2_9COLE|nr:hypothetical protein RN001_001797 [Aquatica leii]
MQMIFNASLSRKPEIEMDQREAGRIKKDESLGCFDGGGRIPELLEFVSTLPEGIIEVALERKLPKVNHIITFKTGLINKNTGG